MEGELIKKIELPNDTLRNGFRNVKVEISAPAHPVEEIERNYHALETQKKYFALSNNFGTHWPMRLEMEKFTLAVPRRLPGLISESGAIAMAGLNGTDEEDFGFEDYLNNPKESVVSVDVHEEMEKRLKMGPVTLRF